MQTVTILLGNISFDEHQDGTREAIIHRIDEAVVVPKEKSGKIADRMMANTYEAWIIPETFPDKITFDLVSPQSVSRSKVRNILIYIYQKIGIDRPSNHDQLTEAVAQDVEETAKEQGGWTSGDVQIALRRQIETITPDQ